MAVASLLEQLDPLPSSSSMRSRPAPPTVGDRVAAARQLALLEQPHRLAFPLDLLFEGASDILTQTGQRALSLVAERIRELRSRSVSSAISRPPRRQRHPQRPEVSLVRATDAHEMGDLEGGVHFELLSEEDSWNLTSLAQRQADVVASSFQQVVGGVGERPWPRFSSQALGPPSPLRALADIAWLEITAERLVLAHPGGRPRSGARSRASPRGCLGSGRGALGNEFQHESSHHGSRPTLIAPSRC